MALHIFGRQFFFLSLLYLVKQVATDSELPGSCPVKIHPSSCGTTTINGTVYAQVLKTATNENFLLPDIPEMKLVKNRLICKPPACISNPCQNGETCTETLYGFNCTQGSHGLTDVEELPSCPENWLYYKGYCYGYFSEVLTFVQASMRCAGFDFGSGTAQTASIHSQQEFEFILSICQSLDCTFTKAWIGLERLEMLFKWTDGTPLDYEAWHPGQPNIVDSLAAGAYINSEHPKPAWEDSPTFLRKHFVCKGPITQ